MTAPAVIEIVLLAALAGSLGVWIVLRRLAFYSHAVGTATFPGLVVAGSLGASALAAGLGSALLAGAGVRALRSAPRLGADAATGLVLVAALAAGALLAGEEHEIHVEELLFGALEETGWGQVAVTAGVLALTGIVAVARERRWLADGLEDGPPDALLLAVIAVAVVAAVSAVGALLVGAILVLPAASARLLSGRLRAIRLLAGALALGLGLLALALAPGLGVDAGALLAVLAGGVFATAALGGRG